MSNAIYTYKPFTGSMTSHSFSGDLFENGKRVAFISVRGETQNWHFKSDAAHERFVKSIACRFISVSVLRKAISAMPLHVA